LRTSKKPGAKRRTESSAKELAEKKEKEPVIAKALADKRRYLAIAKAMAIKSKELNSDKEQQSLLAQQAFNFNNEYDGEPYDNDIYNGLYAALRNQKHPLTLSLEGHQKGGARALDTRRSSEHIYSGGSDGKIIQWSFSGGKWTALEIVPERQNYLVYTLDISPDENWLAAGGYYPMNNEQNYVELYDLRNIKAAPKKITGFRYDIDDIHFAPDGKGFYARDNSGNSIRYSDLSAAKEIIAPKERITSLDLSPDGTKLAGAGLNGNLYVWDVRNNFQETKVKVSNSGLTAVAFAPDGKVAVGNIAGQVYIVDNGRVGSALSGHLANIEHIKFNYAGTFMATASKDYSVRLWNYKDIYAQPPIVLSDHDWVWNVAFTPDDEQLIAGIQSVEETTIGQLDHTIRAWPTKIKTMSSLLCGFLPRNMSKEEWERNVGKDLDYKLTCPSLPANDK
jgi:WD40 repeat protein